MYTGQCCAHLQCATWSEGVRKGEGQSLLFVDKAIDSGSIQVGDGLLECMDFGLTRQMTRWVLCVFKNNRATSSPSSPVQVCAFCRHLGASLRCQETGCMRSYHMPCAAAAGACQDWNQRRILCPQHAHTGTTSPKVIDLCGERTT